MLQANKAIVTYYYFDTMSMSMNNANNLYSSPMFYYFLVIFMGCRILVINSYAIYLSPLIVK